MVSIRTNIEIFFNINTTGENHPLKIQADNYTPFEGIMDQG